MKIIFLGNRKMARLCLEAVLKMAGMSVAAVVTHPDTFEDHKTYESIRGFAQENGIKIFAPESVHELIPTVEALRADLGINVSYLNILPQSFLNLFPLGVINVHSSLLPKYRGRAPINWAIINGEEQTGITIHFVDKGVDTGDIIAQRAVSIDPDEDANQLTEKMNLAAKELLADVLLGFSAGQVPRQKQRPDEGFCCIRRTPADGLIDWTRPTREIYNLIRALVRPYPGAYTYYGGEKLLVWKSSIPEKEGIYLANPGRILRILRDRGVLVKTGSGELLVEKVGRSFEETNDAWTFIQKAEGYFGIDCTTELSALKRMIRQLELRLEKENR